MRHISIILATLAALLLWTSCTDDDSTSADYSRVNDITISGLEKSYSAMAYLGEHIKISPTITTANSSEDMTYQWLLYSSKTGTVVDGDTVKPVVIAQTRDLDYEVVVAPGTYQLRLLASDKHSGYTAYATAALSVATSFSEGFYILKQTANGQTELDLLASKGLEGHDLLKHTQGESMEGKPAAIWPIYNTDYINPDDKAIAQTNALAIVNEDGNVEVNRMADFQTVFSRSNLLYGQMDDDERVYAFFATANGYHFLVTSKGFRYCIQTGKSTGQYSNPMNTTGASTHIASDLLSYGGALLWDEAAHSLIVTDYNANPSPLAYADQTGTELTQNLKGYDCLHIGYNLMNSQATFTAILSDGSGQRYLYLASPSFFGTSLTSRKLLDSSSHMAHATSYSTCGNMAHYIYCTEGGKLYACNYTDDDLPETQLSPEGIGSDETINFVTNQFWKGNASGGKDFDYLIVGTQKGNQYTLRFYEMNGGAPVGKPVKTISGEGKVKMVRYLYSNFNVYDWNFQINVYSITD